MTLTRTGRRYATPLTAEQMITGYGPSWRMGLLSEHVSHFTEAGGVVRAAASGSGASWAVLDGGRRVYPVVCSEIIPIRTEDGMTDGRCGAPAIGEEAMFCEGHRDAYRDMLMSGYVDEMTDEWMRGY